MFLYKAEISNIVQFEGRGKNDSLSKVPWIYYFALFSHQSIYNWHHNLFWSQCNCQKYQGMSSAFFMQCVYTREYRVGEICRNSQAKCDFYGFYEYRTSRVCTSIMKHTSATSLTSLGIKIYFVFTYVQGLLFCSSPFSSMHEVHIYTEKYNSTEYPVRQQQVYKHYITHLYVGFLLVLSG